ncbi:type II toxin-antitoxin system Phd/YefM family antitoxin [Roseateles sp. DC23W]|uniref:Antitoxin n=1 Tax=Pelomonas dachongensis TaxID=3299029 RepID=A0ABW7ELV7_9BURK
MQSWQMQAAKAKLSEVVKQAQSEGPQDITLHGRSVAVVLSREDFERLSGQAGSLLDFMQRSPLAALGDDELDPQRDTSLTRAIEL